MKLAGWVMAPETATVPALLSHGQRLLERAGVASPAADARALLRHALRSEQPLVLVGEVPADVREDYERLLERRSRREPLQLIIGHTAFRYLELQMQPGVFIPRPETEAVCQAAVDELQRVVKDSAPIAVDLCSGSGAIALSLAREVPQANVTAVEKSSCAVSLISTNAQALGLDIQICHADALAEDTLAELNRRCDVVISNPPYIPPGGERLDPEVANFDPAEALWGLGEDGMVIPTGIARTAARLLRGGGLFVMEHAEVQADAARQMLAASGDWREIATRCDLAGRDRMVVARRVA